MMVDYFGGGGGSAGPSYQDIVLASAPLSFWPLQADGLDVRPAANHMTPSGAMAYGTQLGPVIGSKGTRMGDGANTMLRRLTDRLAEDGVGWTAISFECWFRPRVLTTAWLLRDLDDLGNGWGISLSRVANDNQASLLWGGRGWADYTPGGNKIAGLARINEWNHLAISHQLIAADQVTFADSVCWLNGIAHTVTVPGGTGFLYPVAASAAICLGGELGTPSTGANPVASAVDMAYAAFYPRALRGWEVARRVAKA